MSSANITASFNQLFQMFFNKNFSSNMFRHVVLSEKFADTLNEMDELSETMGHSRGTAQNYYVKNL